MPKEKDNEAPELDLSEVKVDEKKASAEQLKQVPLTSANSVSVTKKIMAADRKVKVMIPSTHKDKGAVFASVNGVAFNIPRDIWVEVPASIITCLENAKQTTYRVLESKDADSAKVVSDEVSRIAFQTKG